MKRITICTMGLLLGSLAAWAQAGAALPEAGASSTGAMLGWSLTIIGLIMVLVVIARRLSTGEPWKQEVAITILGLLIFNGGVWLVWSQKQDQLQKKIQGMENRLTAEQRQVSELRAINDGLAQKDAMWRARDQEWQRMVENWQKYAADMKRRFEELTRPKTAPKSSPVPAPAPKKGDGPKPAPKKAA
ncbi:MAG: hypothetical protein N2689_05650 [Verrucomicrobiae bacterium]|nr:hypothetical protein [Verrucomicrobiae bacterium]